MLSASPLANLKITSSPAFRQVSTAQVTVQARPATPMHAVMIAKNDLTLGHALSVSALSTYGYRVSLLTYIRSGERA
jgi:hypothetical protein